MRHSKTIPSEMREFADQVGEFIQHWGFKKVHGRIWTHLFLSPEALDAGEIRKRLSISKALVSMSLSELLEYDVIEVTGKSSRGTLIYRANKDVMGVILNVLKLRERRMLSRILAAHKKLAGQKNASVDSDTLENLGFLILLGCDGLETFLSRFRFDLSPARKLRPNS